MALPLHIKLSKEQSIALVPLYLCHLMQGLGKRTLPKQPCAFSCKFILTRPDQAFASDFDQHTG